MPGQRLPPRRPFRNRPSAFCRREWVAPLIPQGDAWPCQGTDLEDRVMDNLNVRRIRSTDPDAARQLTALRAQLSSQAEIVSPRGRKLTEAVFGEALPPVRVVER